MNVKANKYFSTLGDKFGNVFLRHTGIEQTESNCEWAFGCKVERWELVFFHGGNWNRNEIW